MADVFISYKREDRSRARRLADAIEAHGWTVWWDPALRAGERYDDVIEKAIGEAGCVIVLWSALSVKSNYVKDEAGLGLRLGKLVPILTDTSEPPLRFNGLHAIRLTDWGSDPPGPEFSLLVRDVAEMLGKGRETRTGTVEQASAGASASTPTEDPPSPFAGLWEGEWLSLKNARRHRALLSIPPKLSPGATATLNVRYRRGAQTTEVEEVLAASVSGSSITLIGRSFRYVVRDASSNYTLDHFILELSEDRRTLSGRLFVSRGERAITFQKVPDHATG